MLIKAMSQSDDKMQKLDQKLNKLVPSFYR